MPIDDSAPHSLPDALRKELANLGHVEGRQIGFDVRYGNGREHRAAAEATDLVKTGVGVIVAPFASFVRAAMAARAGFPIVMVSE